MKIVSQTLICLFFNLFYQLLELDTKINSIKNSLSFELDELSLDQIFLWLVLFKLLKEY